MEQAMVSVATGALKLVLGKLATLLIEEFKLVVGVRGKIRFLQAELEAMHAFLLKMSWVEEPDEQAKSWMKQVRELSYDIHDSIDDFMLRVGDGESTKPKGVKGFIKRSMNLLTETKTRRRIGKEVKSLETLVKEVADRRAGYRIDDSICKATNVTVDPRVSCQYKDPSELEGIEGPTEKIIKMLNGGEEDAPVPQLKLVSIVGFGGLGKTTLARRVYDTFGKHFDYRAFVSVSRHPNMVMILKDILIQVRYPKTIPEIEESLIGTISMYLENKRYFIVVDDVWDVQSWDTINRGFSKNSHGSKIITTTRVSKVAESCCIPYGGCVHNLMPLSTVDSERLFLRRIFGNGQQCPRHLKRVSDKILEKCGGLPLAILAISGLLATNRQEDQWEQVQNSIGQGLGSNPAAEGMMRILSFSYFNLNPCLRSCLLYLSIYPEDDMIYKEDLIMRWIVEGFIPEEHGVQTIYEIGERCYNELVNRSLIQPAEGIHFVDRKDRCRVHDTILDFVISKSKEDNFVTLLGVPGVHPDPQNKARRLSLQSGCEIPTDLLLSNARSLVAFGVAVKLPSLKEFKNLRALSFEGCRQLEDHLVVGIGNLCHLKHLRFHKTGIRKFPEEIVKLQFLETLEISLFYSGLNKIPSTFCQLRRLVHLAVDSDFILPDDIGGMQALQVLEGIDVFRHSTKFCQQLGQLTNLRKLQLELWSFSAGENFQEQIKELVSSIRKLGNAKLYSLQTDGGYDYEDEEPMEEFAFHLDESWFYALCGLRELVMKAPIPLRVPRSMNSLSNVHKLWLHLFEIQQADIDILGNLPALQELTLFAEDYAAAGPKGRPLRISPNHGFSFLTYFLIATESGDLGLIFEAGSMPKLQKLVLIFKEYDSWSRTKGNFDFGIGHLACLTSVGIARPDEIEPESKAPFERAIEAHPNHPSLEELEWQ
ncbi:disease resistance protein RGA5-like isoform X2 [Panicum virgatum]|uniref:disease resistance protein RGA5-like isoform X2 n=1 Tax=Panicum virgatum TaxID=38727 RepID=UPI0019D60E44|nr:disease resistance protein RGA5-like isoform X2 [Panicum virgatum]